MGKDKAMVRTRKRTGIDVIHPEILVVLGSAERALLVVRAIDAAGYEIIWYVSNLRSRWLGSWTFEDSSRRQFCRCSGGDGASMRKG